MADIFISYAREDQDKVKPLAKALEAHGREVWWDAKIRSGEAFDRIIEKAIAKARCVIVVWSSKSVNSDWVRAEAGDGLERDILISVAIDVAVRPPLRFRNIHTVPLIDWDGEISSPLFDKILSDLSAIIKEDIVNLPKIGDIISPDEALKLCKHYKLDYLVSRIETNPDKYKSWTFDGCSGMPDEIMGFFVGCDWNDITYRCCLPHDLCYAFGDAGNEIERQHVDLNFYDHLMTKAGMKKWCAAALLSDPCEK